MGHFRLKKESGGVERQKGGDPRQKGMGGLNQNKKRTATERKGKTYPKKKKRMGAEPPNKPPSENKQLIMTKGGGEGRARKKKRNKKKIGENARKQGTSHSGLICWGRGRRNMSLCAVS